MVATVQIGEKNGTAGTFTDKSGTPPIRMKNADNATVDNNDPMVIPATGQDYSYEKWLRLKCTVLPDTQITNPRFYTDGAKGWAAQVKLWAKKVTTYAQPAEATGTAGYSDAFGYTSGGALTLGTGTYATAATGEFGDHTVLMLEVEAGATQGSLATETMTWAYDEI